MATWSTSDWLTLFGLVIGAVLVMLSGMAAIIQKLVAADLRLIRNDVRDLKGDLENTNLKIDSESRKRERLQGNFKELIGFLKGRSCLESSEAPCFDAREERESDSTDPVREAARMRRLKELEA